MPEVQNLDRRRKMSGTQLLREQGDEARLHSSQKEITQCKK